MPAIVRCGQLLLRFLQALDNQIADCGSLLGAFEKIEPSDQALSHQIGQIQEYWAVAIEPRAIWVGIFDFKRGRRICNHFLPRLLRCSEGGQVRKESASNGFVDGKMPQRLE